ncbi:titin [Trichonephila inaurata madagascariensis]|uniref:Titin n=1 Tax=Trichonephila inaurata madagascariensis TaxID=2747483 RepID=A0A8X6YMC4_9ARAC|nr:titin [Trichonephila inaurata madagascariensis]
MCRTDIFIRPTKQLLMDSFNFFTKAQTAETKLDQIEIQLSTSDSTSLWSTVEECVNVAIQCGRQILSSTGGRAGKKEEKTVGCMQSKRIGGFGKICRFQKVLRKIRRAYKMAEEQQCSIADERHGNRSSFEDSPNLVRAGGRKQVVHSKSENLKQQWVSKEMDELESLVNQTIASPDQSKIRQIEEKQLALRQEILQVNNNGKNFLQDARKVDDMHLNMTQPCMTVEEILNRLELRNVSLNTQWLNFQNEITATKETLIQWDNIINDANRVLKNAQEIERKLYPIIPQELKKVESIISFLEKQMLDVLPQIKSIQRQRKYSSVYKKADTVKSKGQLHKQRALRFIPRVFRGHRDPSEKRF